MIRFCRCRVRIWALCSRLEVWRGRCTAALVDVAEAAHVDVGRVAVAALVDVGRAAEAAHASSPNLTEHYTRQLLLIASASSAPSLCGLIAWLKLAENPEKANKSAYFPLSG